MSRITSRVNAEIQAIRGVQKHEEGKSDRIQWIETHFLRDWGGGGCFMVISLSKFPIKWMMNRINVILI